MILHIINKTKDATLIDQCMRYCSQGDSVLLVEDGVYLALTSSPSLPSELSNDITLYALKEDLIVRGLELDKVQMNVKPVHMSEYIELTASHSKVINWA